MDQLVDHASSSVQSGGSGAPCSRFLPGRPPRCTAFVSTLVATERERSRCGACSATRRGEATRVGSPGRVPRRSNRSAPSGRPSGHILHPRGSDASLARSTPASSHPKTGCWSLMAALPRAQRSFDPSTSTSPSPSVSPLTVWPSWLLPRGMSWPAAAWRGCGCARRQPRAQVGRPRPGAEVPGGRQAGRPPRPETRG